MKLKKAIVALPMVGALMLTACGGGETDTEGTFSENLQIEGVSVPKQWQGAAGWTQEGVQKVVTLPKHIAYLAEQDVELEDGSTVTSTDLYFYNNKGEEVTRSKTPKKITVEETQLFTTYKDGKAYLLLVQQGENVLDETSTVEPEPTVLLTGFNNRGKQLFRTTHTLAEYDGGVTLEQGLLLLNNSGSDESIPSVIDPESGKLSAVPSKDGSVWLARVDGVDIYAKDKGEPDDDLHGDLTNGDWTIKAARSAGYWEVGVLGQYLSAKWIPDNGNEETSCGLIDPQTGEYVKGSEELDGLCYLFEDDTYPPEQTDPAVIYTDTGTHYETDAVLFPKQGKDGKSYVVPSSVSFQPLTTTTTGVAYGVSEVSDEEQAAALRINKDSAPKILPDVNRIPIAVSGNGIAAFSVERVAGTEDPELFFLLKK